MSRQYLVLRFHQSISFFGLFNTKSVRLADQLESPTRATAACMHCINSCFVISWREVRRLEFKPVPIIVRAFRFVDIGPILVCRSVCYKTIVNEQLDLDTRARIAFIDSPAAYHLPISLIDHTAQIHIRGRKIETDRDCSD
jgi:hypothetical protein